MTAITGKPRFVGSKTREFAVGANKEAGKIYFPTDANEIIIDGKSFSGVTEVTYDTTNKKFKKTINGVESDVVTAATIVADGGGSNAFVIITAPLTQDQNNPNLQTFQSSVYTQIQNAWDAGKIPVIQIYTTASSYVKVALFSDGNTPAKFGGTYAVDGHTTLKIEATSIGGTVETKVTGPSDVGLNNVTNESKATMFTNAELTGTPTAPTAPVGTNTTQIASTAFVKAEITAVLAANDAMRYRGVIPGTSVEAYGTLTPAANAGDTFKVNANGKINGIDVEVGDMLICLVDDTPAATNDQYLQTYYLTINANWNFIQKNEDGVVSGPAGASDGAVAVFDGITGKVIRSSGYTIGKSVPANAKFTDTEYIIEGYYYGGNWHRPLTSGELNRNATSSDFTNDNKVTPEFGKIYLAVDNKIPYIWNGTALVNLYNNAVAATESGGTYSGGKDGLMSAADKHKVDELYAAMTWE